MMIITASVCVTKIDIFIESEAYLGKVQTIRCKMHVIYHLVLVFYMLMHVIIIMGTMLQKFILQRQLVPHTVDDILNILPVAAYRI